MTLTQEAAIGYENPHARLGSKCDPFESFVPLPSNVDALEAATLFERSTIPLVALIGPSGWGKTHILESVAGAVGTTVVRSVNDWADTGARSTGTRALLIDNVQQATGRTKSRVRLQVALERRMRSRRPTMLAFSDLSPAEVRQHLPRPSEWRIVEVAAPSLPERALLVRGLALSEGVALSQGLIFTLAHRMKGNGRTLRGALRRLKLAGGQWVTDQETLCGCGVLTPFFADCSSWDLAEHVCESAEAIVSDPGLSRPLSIFLLLKVASLPESSVAAYFELRPAAVYRESARFAKRLEACPATREELAKVIEFSARSLGDN